MPAGPVDGGGASFFAACPRSPQTNALCGQQKSLAAAWLLSAALRHSWMQSFFTRPGRAGQPFDSGR